MPTCTTHLCEFDLLPAPSATYVQNNWWGVTPATHGTQTITVPEGDAGAWATTWDWRFEADWAGVQSYSAAILGSHQTRWKYPAADSSMPIDLASETIDPVRLAATWTTVPSGPTPNRYNTTYDVWLY